MVTIYSSALLSQVDLKFTFKYLFIFGQGFQKHKHTNDEYIKCE